MKKKPKPVVLWLVWRVGARSPVMVYTRRRAAKLELPMDRYTLVRIEVPREDVPKATVRA
jgi:hypothetical protein